MFIGHLALGFAAKRIVPRTSLATLAAAACLPDIMAQIFLLVGIESVRIAPGFTPFKPVQYVSYEWTHSLVMVLVWAAVFGLVYRARTGFARGAWVMAALVVSHWALDWIVHAPDLALAPGFDGRFGLGLWRSVPATMMVEGALFTVALADYITTTRARNRKGAFGMWGFVAFVLMAYVGKVGHVPPGVAWLAGLGLIRSAVSIGWIWWFERNREPRVAPPNVAGSTPSRVR